jgi:hypothetical protein
MTEIYCPKFHFNQFKLHKFYVHFLRSKLLKPQKLRINFSLSLHLIGFLFLQPMMQNIQLAEDGY